MWNQQNHQYLREIINNCNILNLYYCYTWRSINSLKVNIKTHATEQQITANITNLQIATLHKRKGRNLCSFSYEFGPKGKTKSECISHAIRCIDVQKKKPPRCSLTKTARQSSMLLVRMSPSTRTTRSTRAHTQNAITLRAMNTQTTYLSRRIVRGLSSQRKREVWRKRHAVCGRNEQRISKNNEKSQ